jgi:cardiolipin synthase
MISFWLHHSLSALSFLLTLLFASFVLRAKKPAGSTMAWLFFIILIPYLGIPIYLFLSNTKFPTRLSRKNRLYRPDKVRLSDSNLSNARKILAAAGIDDPRPNHSVQLIPSGELAYSTILRHIENASQSICITTFIFANDEVGKAIVQALIKKASQGVRVRVIVDSLGAALIRHPSFTELKKVGGQVAYFMPLLHIPLKSRTNLRNHRKLMVVDSKIAIIGGMNLAKEYLGPKLDPNRWVDLAAEIQGDSVRNLENIFAQDWLYANRGKIKEDPLVVAPTSSGDSELLAQVVASGPDVVGFPLYDVLLSSIYEAKKSIWIVTPYFIPDESLTTALELAAKRGVCVRILVPRKSNHRLADIARGSFLRQIQEAGAEVHLYPRMLHAKVVLIDAGMLLLGSANFDMRSLLLNYELGVLFYGANTIDDTHVWIESCIAKAQKGYLARSFWREIAEGIGRIIGPII